MMKKTVIAILSILVIASSHSSCTRVEYGASEDMPGSVQVSFSFDWQGMETPEEMYVLMSRIINTVHYGWEVAPDGTVRNPVSDTPQTETGTETSAPDRNPVSGTEPEAGQEPDMTVLNGEYFIMAFNSDEDVLTAENVGPFVTDEATAMSSIILRAKGCTDEEVDEAYGGDWTDFNQLVGFIHNTGPVYLDVRQIRIDPANPAEISLTPSPLTQEITFSVDIETEDGVEIQDITAEISGLAGSVEAMSGYISDETTYRAAFKMYEAGQAASGKRYEGKIHTFGLFPSKDKNYITGPGILQLSIKASDGTDTKVFHAGINILETIASAEMIETAGYGLYRISKDKVSLQIPARLTILKDQIAQGDGQGVEIWVDSDEYFDTEI